MNPLQTNSQQPNKQSLHGPDINHEYPSKNHIVDISLVVNRFGWDVLCVIFFTLAVLSLLGLTGFTTGAVIDSWVNVLWSGLGWGSFSLVGLLLVFSYLSLRQHFPRFPSIKLSQLLSLEGLVFTILIISSIVGGMSLQEAERGNDGGVIGWGLATLLTRLLPIPWVMLIMSVLGVFFFLNALGIPQPLRKKLRKWFDIPVQETTNYLNDPDQKVTVTLEISDQEKHSKRSQTNKGLDDLSASNIAGIAQVMKRDERLPPLNFLMQDHGNRPDDDLIRQKALQIEKTLGEFGVPAKVVGFRIGPTVTQYAVEPGFIDRPGPDGENLHQKVKVSQISVLTRDLALALSAERLRIEAPVPGRSYVGIEIPNEQNAVVRLRPILESDAFQRLASPLAIALGRDVSGQPVVADLARMPHLLIAGTTGSGKSVCIAALTTCLVANNAPDDLRIAMLDPKKVELTRFNGLPHLLGTVETEPERMLGVLRWALSEMDSRYKILEESNAKDLEAYNRRMQKKRQATLPRIVVLIDELADLMYSSQEQTEHSLIRLAQMARATGIHLVVATQRPSTEVVTGLIKANFPARISFNVASSIDSRVILDVNGAESLLGKGDMLFLNPEIGSPQRSQGVIVTDQEVNKIITFWQRMSPKPANQSAPWEGILVEEESGSDNLIDQAIQVIRQEGHASASLLQRRLRIGYPRAARLVDELEEMGIVGPGQVGGRERDVLLPPEEDEPNDVS